MAETGTDAILETVAAGATKAGVFGEVSVKDGRLVCAAKESAEPAAYRVDVAGGEVAVSLVTADRWLSESIETDLVHSGDKIEELLDEELVELGYNDGPLTIQHYRSDDLLFTFRTVVPGGGSDSTLLVLLGYEACFRQLGDMEADGEED